VTHQRGKGRAFVWGDEWKNIAMIKQFWVNILRWLGGHVRSAAQGA
jgi:hypothetical protein